MGEKHPVRSAEPGRTEEEERALQLASHGTGPLLQRDYVAVVEGSDCSPETAVETMRREFPKFAPELLVTFDRPDGAAGPLDPGDTMHVHLHGAGHSGVVVNHVDDRSLTMRTLDGHQEAGTITFGVYPDEAGRLVFRIRSRARQRNLPRFLGYELLGKHAQTQIWIHFLENWAQACGGKLVGDVILSTDEVEETAADRGEEEQPTFDPREMEAGPC